MTSIISFPANHSEIVKCLVLCGADLNSLNKDGFKPVELANFHTESWEILQDAGRGYKPELEEVVDLPIIPEHALNPTKKAKKSSGKKKGKKGKKGKSGKKGKKKKK